MIRDKAKQKPLDSNQCYNSRHKIYPTSRVTEIKKGSTLELGLEPLDYVNRRYLLYASFVPGLVL